MGNTAARFLAIGAANTLAPFLVLAAPYYPCGAAVFIIGFNYASWQIFTVYLTQEVHSIRCTCAVRAVQLTEDQNIRDIVALEKPYELLGHTWEQYMGRPMVQTVRDTCGIMASIKCVEAVHHLQHDKLHGNEGTTTTTFPFPYRVTAAAASDLLEACRVDGVWKPIVGAFVSDVLMEIREMGGVPAAATTGGRDGEAQQRLFLFLPLRSWEEHIIWNWNADSAPAPAPAGGGGPFPLSPEQRVANLLYNSGPCIGLLWLSPLYGLYRGDGDDALVYTSGFAPGKAGNASRKEQELQHPGVVGWHAVVCFGYRFRGNEMHVLGQDNHDETGPRRLIHVHEFCVFYTLSV